MRAFSCLAHAIVTFAMGSSWDSNNVCVYKHESLYSAMLYSRCLAAESILDLFVYMHAHNIIHLQAPSSSAGPRSDLSLLMCVLRFEEKRYCLHACSSLPLHM